MQIAKDILKKANVTPLLSLVKKDEKGVPRGTGPHRVKILEGKVGRRIDYSTKKEKQVLWLYVEEDGVKKKYPINLMSEDGSDIHYLIKKLADIPEGSEVIMEAKKTPSGNTIIDLVEASEEKKAVEPDDDIPVIEEEEDIPLEEDENYGDLR